MFKNKTVTVFLIVALALAAVAGLFLPLEAPEARLREKISIDARDDAYLYNGADLYQYSDDHSTQKFHLDGATGNVDSEGSLDFGTAFKPGFADLTVTDGTTPTISAMVTALDSAAAVTITLAACTVEGQVTVLIGDDANTVTINDTNLRSHDGAALALGQYDVAMLICQDTEWIQLIELATQ